MREASASSAKLTRSGPPRRRPRRCTRPPRPALRIQDASRSRALRVLRCETTRPRTRAVVAARQTCTPWRRRQREHCASLAAPDRPATDAPIRSPGCSSCALTRSARDVRLLFAVEPAGTVTVLAVLDGEDAIAEHRAQAIELAGELLTDIRAGDWPPADAPTARGPGGDIRRRGHVPGPVLPGGYAAPSPSARSRPRGAAHPGRTARGTGLSLAEVARKTGIGEQRLRTSRGWPARG